MMCYRVPALLATAALSLSIAACNVSATTSDQSQTSQPTSTQSSSFTSDIGQRIAALEKQYDARVGVSAVNVVDGHDNSDNAARIAYRNNDRFGYASTLKVFAAAAMLHLTSPAARSRVVQLRAAEVEASGYAPITRDHIRSGMTLLELAEAAVRFSDNAALNQLITYIGGPPALQQQLRILGDPTAQVVDDEPKLNTIVAHSIANTSTPAGFTTALTHVAHGTYLDSNDAATLHQWMRGNATGDALIRAGAPAGADVADKSGGAGGIRNDIAVVTLANGQRVALTIFTTKHDANARYDDSLVAEVARTVLH